MTPIEIIALIAALVILIKFFLITLNLKRFLSVTEGFVRQPALIGTIYAVAAIVVGYYLFLEFSIVQIAAVLLFASLLIEITLLPFIEPLFKGIKRKLTTENRTFSGFRLLMFLWAAFAGLVLYRLFN